MNTVQHTHYTIIHPCDFKCVWMSAGILSYQLCDKQYDCESCPLDKAMRKHFVDDTMQYHRTQSSEELLPLRDDYLYSTHHCWLKEITQNRFRIGIEPGLAHTLPVPKAIVLPSEGQTFQKNRVSVWMVYEEGIFPVFAPVTGEVIARNININQNPRDISSHPFENGWLYEIEIREPLPVTLMNSFDAQRTYRLDAEKLKELILTASNQSTGRSHFPDGGQPVKQISELLGQKKYLRLLVETYGKQ